MKDSNVLPALGGLASVVVVIGTLRAMLARSRAHRHKLSWETCSTECAALQADAVDRTNARRNISSNCRAKPTPWTDHSGVFYPVSKKLTIQSLCPDVQNGSADSCTHSHTKEADSTSCIHWPVRAQHIDGIGHFGMTQGERPSRAQLSKCQLDAIGSGDNASPIFRFGAIADIQYADLPVGETRGAAVRTYQHSLCALNQAVLSWNLVPGGLQFIAQ
jgi:hypothetical protein